MGSEMCIRDRLERKPLTDERIKDIYRHIPDFNQWVFSGAILKFARAIEAAHGITDPLADGGKPIGEAS